MTIKKRFLMSAVLLALSVVCPALERPLQAQVPPPEETQAQVSDGDGGVRPLTAADQRCFELLKRLSDDLAQRPRFELKLTNQIVVKSGTPADADAQMRQTVELAMKVDNSDSAPRIQLLINRAGNDPDFVIDWNKGMLTRIFLPEKIYSQTATRDLRHDLRQCQFTAENLAGAHGDFLLRPDLVEHLRHQVVHLTDLSDDKESPHFHLELTDGREMELWFGIRDGVTIPVKLESHRTVALGENQNVDVVTTGEFSWTFHSGEINWLALPDTSALRRVSDLQNDMMGADSADRVGKEFPSSVVLDMSGMEVDKANELKAETKPTLLYFWATWAAPSLREIEGVQQFAKELEESGIRVHPVNVGESQDAVQQFAEAKKIEFPVWRDPDAKLCAKLGILNLPAVVVVHQGKVVTILENVTADSRDTIRQTLKKLSSGQ